MSPANRHLNLEHDANSDIAGIKIPDSKMARDLTQLIRDTESDLLFHHSTRVYLFGALTGERKGLKFDPELLYVGAMFHDIGLTEGFATRSFGSRLMVPMRPEIFYAATVSRKPRSRSSGTQSPCTRRPAFRSTRSRRWRSSPRVSRWTCSESLMNNSPMPSGKQWSRHIRAAVDFKNNIIQAFYDGMKHRPDSTFGTVNDDVLALKDSSFQRTNFCRVILNSAWAR